MFFSFFFFCFNSPLFSNLCTNTKPQTFTPSVQLQFGEPNFPQKQRAVVTNIMFQDLSGLAGAVFCSDLILTGLAGFHHR